MAGIRDGQGIASPLPARAQTVQWVIAGLLALIAAGLWLRVDSPGLTPALAQGQQLAGARGVYAFTGQIERGQYGLFMLDVDQGTVWCYAFETVGGASKLRLVAARTWIYDRYLQDFNCAPPGYREVRQLVSQQREQAGSDEAVPGAGDDSRSSAEDN